jgi:mono/diheme cytochrome c family protein
MSAPMKRISVWALIACVAGGVVSAQDSKAQRGKYLVEEVARCQECHTPRTDTNDFDRAKWMKGATLVAAPSTPIQGWHQKSPDISSTSPLWQRWGDDGFVKFLETAKNPRGGGAGAPMPRYTVSHEDADAIAIYLKSLP